MAPLISVVIPAYNHARYIAQTFNSILQQDYEKLELIVVDDGSSDDTFEIMKGLESDCQKRFQRVVFISHPNQGVSATAKEAVARSQGEFFYLIASDDLAKTQAISTLYSFLSSSEGRDYALAVGDCEVIDENGHLTGLDENGLISSLDSAAHRTLASFQRSISHGVDFNSQAFGTYETLLLGNYIPNGYLIRRAAYEDVGGYEASLEVEDWYLMLQLAKKFKLKYLDQILFSYRRHSSNSMLNSKRMLAGLARTINGERLLAIEGKDKQVKNSFAAMQRSRTKDYPLWQLGPALEYGVEKFGLGDYFAIRTKYLKLFGHKLVRLEKVYLGGLDDQPVPR